MTSSIDNYEQDRNRRLRAVIAAGNAPLDDGAIRTMRGMAEANLDIPGPRVTQLLDKLDRIEHREPHTLRAPEQMRYPGGKDGMWRASCSCGYVTGVNPTELKAWQTASVHLLAMTKGNRE